LYGREASFQRIFFQVYYPVRTLPTRRFFSGFQLLFFFYAWPKTLRVRSGQCFDRPYFAFLSPRPTGGSDGSQIPLPLLFEPLFLTAHIDSCRCRNLPPSGPLPTSCARLAVISLSVAPASPRRPFLSIWHGRYPPRPSPAPPLRRLLSAVHASSRLPHVPTLFFRYRADDDVFPLSTRALFPIS